MSASTIKQSELITTSQKRSADQLNQAALNLSARIEGTDSVPSFLLVTKNNKGDLQGILMNRSRLPAYNVYTRIINYDSLLKCKVSRIEDKLVINNSRFLTLSKELNSIPVIQPLGTFSISLPFPGNTGSNSRGRYILTVQFAGCYWEEQCIWAIENESFKQSIRVLKYKNNKLIARYFVYEPKLLKNVNWDREFPMNSIASYVYADLD